MKYRKKPVVIEAVLWDGTNCQEISDFCGKDIIGALVWKSTFNIKTLEGMHRASIGDYIIKGVKGEFYPCKPDIFKMTYEVAE